MSAIAEPPVQEKQLLTRDEMAARLQWSTATLDRIKVTPGFPTLMVGRKPMFNPVKVQEWQDKRAEAGLPLHTRTPKRGRK